MNLLKNIFAVSTLLCGTLSTVQADYITVYDLDPSTYIDGAPQELGRIDLTLVGTVGSFEGSISSVYPISAYGARYILNSIVTVGGEDKVYPIDTTVVGPYPTVVFETSSTDPFAEFRTRADERFKVAITCSNFNPEPDAPTSLKQLYVEHLMCEYPDGEYSFSVANTANWTAAKASFGAYVNEEGRYILTNPAEEFADGDNETSLTSLPSAAKYLLAEAVTDGNDARADLQRGEERFVVYARPREDAPWVVVTEKTIRVFPGAQTAIRGSFDSFVSDSFQLDKAKRLTAIPSLTAKCKELYPASTTRLKVYRGDDDTGELIAWSADAAVESSEPQSFNTLVPQDGVLRIDASDLGDLDDGYYFTQVETTTDIGGGRTEALEGGQIFFIDRKLNVNSNVNSSE